MLFECVRRVYSKVHVCLKNKDILPPCRNDASHRRHPRCVASAI